MSQPKKKQQPSKKIGINKVLSYSLKKVSGFYQIIEHSYGGVKALGEPDIKPLIFAKLASIMEKEANND